MRVIQQQWPRLWAYSQLMRLNRPIGTYLLLWPTLWSLWIAAQGLPNTSLIIIFSLGVFLMRSAGCVINDFADRHFDGHVKRTQLRPLITGKASAKEAIWLFFVLVLFSFLLVLQTNTYTVLLSFGALALATCYPFMKRYTHFPQVVLGAAFSWSIPMAFSAQTGELSVTTWLLYAANLSWTVAYDTQYAMVDRDDDLQIGIKSTAILFGQADNLIIAILQLLALLLMVIVGIIQQLDWPFYTGLIAASLLFIYQHYLTHGRNRERCFLAFLNNHWVGLLIFLGTMTAFW
ncbi:4-hydroxybenzoate octaprenyltransferase [Zooshikella ganghwensis]|uniref:4-hydroxybenzoate octaprenyltransferase n=1 Tax=Zooshikella ganghwensis TaxID=202772 RepID=A0A4P9VJX3_9GAMM|nr:4-hydroxybenzoate octaprenyltransferase [Zooshikella ganghwensis]RDH42102.1 4-hydroxybenzoate octaprenyltransferase [Zooshikella ganghwensis]